MVVSRMATAGTIAVDHVIPITTFAWLFLVEAGIVMLKGRSTQTYPTSKRLLRARKNSEQGVGVEHVAKYGDDRPFHALQKS